MTFLNRTLVKLLKYKFSFLINYHLLAFQKVIDAGRQNDATIRIHIVSIMQVTFLHISL